MARRNPEAHRRAQIGRLYTYFIRKHGCTVKQVSRATGVSPASITRLAQNPPRPEVLVPIGQFISGYRPED